MPAAGVNGHDEGCAAFKPKASKIYFKQSPVVLATVVENPLDLVSEELELMHDRGPLKQL